MRLSLHGHDDVRVAAHSFNTAEKLGSVLYWEIDCPKERRGFLNSALAERLRTFGGTDKERDFPVGVVRLSLLNNMADCAERWAAQYAEAEPDFAADFTDFAVMAKSMAGAQARSGARPEIS